MSHGIPPVLFEPADRAADLGCYGEARTDEPVLRADPRDRIEVPQASHVPVLLALAASLCLVAALAARQWWLPARQPVAAVPQATAPVAGPVATPPPAPQAAAVEAPPLAPPPPAPTAHARHGVQQDGHASVRHAAARVRTGRAVRLHAGRRSGEGRA